MAALQFGGLHSSCKAHPIPVINLTKQCAFWAHHTLGDPIAGVTKSPTKLRFHGLTWRTTSNPNRFHLVRNRTYTLKTVAFQAVAADHDSEGSDTSVPSAQDTNFVSDWMQTERFRNFLLSSCENFNDFASTLRKPGTTKKLEVIIEGLRGRLQSLKKEKFLSLLQNSTISEWLHTVDPWISWPAIIFGTSYLMMTIIVGFGVTNELLPLWILGPLMTGFLIKASYETISVSKVIAAKYSGHYVVLREKSFLFYEDARSGKLPGKIIAAGSSKFGELKVIIATKKKTLTLYVQSGQAYLDFLHVLEQLRCWLTEMFEDFKEWIWPYWRRLLRYLQKIF